MTPCTRTGKPAQARLARGGPSPRAPPPYVSSLKGWHPAWPSEFHPHREVQAKVILLGHQAGGVGLWILRAIPDERNVQVQAAGQIDLQRRRRVMCQPAGLLVRDDGLVAQFQIDPLAEFHVEARLGKES